MSLLSVNSVTKRFGALAGLRDVSFELQKGEVLGVMGPNGAGKTTLFNVLTGICKPDRGEITFEGKRIDGKKPYDISHLGISRTFQLVKPFLSQNVFENVFLAANFARKQMDGSLEAAEQAISLAGLVSLRDKQVATLPLIYRKRVELARAIATVPKIVLLDEPMAGLNPTEINDFLAIIRQMNSQGISILIIEHVMGVIMGLSSRIIVLDHGEKIAEGRPSDIANDAKVIKIYLGD